MPIQVRHDIEAGTLRIIQNELTICKPEVLQEPRDLQAEGVVELTSHGLQNKSQVQRRRSTNVQHLGGKFIRMQNSQ